MNLLEWRVSFFRQFVKQRNSRNIRRAFGGSYNGRDGLPLRYGTLNGESDYFISAVHSACLHVLKSCGLFWGDIYVFI
jgi:hypothetical protein